MYTENQGRLAQSRATSYRRDAQVSLHRTASIASSHRSRTFSPPSRRLQSAPLPKRTSLYLFGSTRRVQTRTARRPRSSSSATTREFLTYIKHPYHTRHRHQRAPAPTRIVRASVCLFVCLSVCLPVRARASRIHRPSSTPYTTRRSTNTHVIRCTPTNHARRECVRVQHPTATRDCASNHRWCPASVTPRRVTYAPDARDGGARGTWEPKI